MAHILDDAAWIQGPSSLPLVPVPTGWTCPSCGHSYAPWVPECHHCPVPPSFIAKGNEGIAATGPGVWAADD